MQTTVRNATLSDLAALLKDQQSRKHDVVAPAGAIRSVGGRLVIDKAGELLADPVQGITAGPGTFTPTVVCDEGIADKLGIPVQYLKRLREQRPDIYDANVNGWLRGDGDVAADARNFLVRCFKGDDDTSGVARAFLSDSFKIIDNFDALTAALQGVRDAKVNIEITGCDLTERRMYVRLVAPEVEALAPTLLERYRSPFSGQSGRDLPVVWAGLVLSNSETGGGAFTITPRMEIQICKNGMTRTQDALRAVHLGGKLDEGLIRWSEETQQKQIELITAKARDAVATFLDVDYMKSVITEVEAKAAKPIENPADAVQVVGKKLQFSQETISGVLDHFIKGGDVTAGGVFQAVTSYAQTVTDADAAFELEASAFRALEFAAA